MVKKKLGFETPASNIEQKFEEIEKLLAAKKSNWNKIYDVAQSNLDTTIERSEEDYAHWVIEASIARLGMEIAETHQRLASCEKAINELKLR